eukprot:scaffold53746_cov22-Tisochrysis_lutea.AAC.1
MLEVPVCAQRLWGVGNILEISVLLPTQWQVQACTESVCVDWSKLVLEQKGTSRAALVRNERALLGKGFLLVLPFYFAMVLFNTTPGKSGTSCAIRRWSWIAEW